MGLPRYLREKEKEMIGIIYGKKFPEDYISYSKLLKIGKSKDVIRMKLAIDNGFFDCALEASVIAHSHDMFRYLRKNSIRFQLKTYYGYYETDIRGRHIEKLYKENDEDNMIEAYAYLNTEIKDNKYFHNYFKFKIPYWFSHQYLLIRTRKEREGERNAKKIIDIAKFKTRSYSSRIFPPSLRILIYERDGYSCKICGRHKDSFPKEDHLEVDHIVEWEDGGETSYNNGQTVCSSCNKGKHHAKKKMRKLLA